jgi:hypothetical protein
MRRRLACWGLVSALELTALSASGQTAHAASAQVPLAQSLAGEAKTAYASAQVLFNNADYAGALSKYGQAYDLSKDPRLLFNMAICARTLHAYARMQSLLVRYRREAGASISAKDREDVDAALAAIGNLVGTVTLTVSEEGARITLDNESVGVSPLSDPQVLDLGEHTIAASKPGFDPASQTVTIAGGSQAALNLVLVAQRHVARFAVAADDDATIFLDGKVTAKGRFEGQLTPGPHALRVTETGKVPYQADVDLRDGETRTVQVTLESEKHGTAIWPWIVGGAVVAAGAVVGGYFLFKPASAPAAPPDQLGSLQLSAWGR